MDIGPTGFLPVDIVVAVVIGYWCLTIYRKKARSPGAGFALGFLLTLFLFLLGAAIALAIAYTRSDKSRPLPKGKLLKF